MKNDFMAIRICLKRIDAHICMCIYVYIQKHIDIPICIHTYIHSVYIVYAAAAAKSCQSCPTLCDPTDSSPPGSAIPGILQARILEWVAISFSSA